MDCVHHTNKQETDNKKPNKARSDVCSLIMFKLNSMAPDTN